MFKIGDRVIFKDREYTGVIVYIHKYDLGLDLYRVNCDNDYLTLWVNPREIELDISEIRDNKLNELLD